MKRLLVLAVLCVLLGAGFTASGLYCAGILKTNSQLEYYTCPLLKYHIVGEGRSESYYREWKHDIDNDGKADIVALYIYSKTLKKWVELDRKYIGGVDA